jgi:hypothetical protein
MQMSPTIFKEKNYRFFFFSREEKRKHIHVIGPGGEAKFWIEPEIEVASVTGFSDKEVGRLKKTIIKRKDEINNSWEEYFGG